MLDQLEREDRIGIVMLGRPYHHDPGLNHEILEEFQKLGYPIFSQSTLPLDEDMLERCSARKCAREWSATRSISPTSWKNSYSCSTNHKVWAAKFTARHPNLVALEISSFKCGHDAPIYGVIEGIIENSGTPYFCFKDLDENKPTGSIRIRVETIDYFLRRYRETIIKRRKAEEEIDAQLAQMEAQLRGQAGAAAGSGRGLRRKTWTKSKTSLPIGGKARFFVSGADEKPFPNERWRLEGLIRRYAGVQSKRDPSTSLARPSPGRETRVAQRV